MGAGEQLGSSAVTATVTVAHAQDATFQHVRQHIAAYASPQDARGFRLVFMTFALWFGAFALGGWLFKHVPLNTWWGVAAIVCWGVVRIGTVARALITMHDAIHNALFKRRWMNYWTGIFAGLLNCVDAPDWHLTHMQHHTLWGMEEEVEKDPDLTILWSVDEWKAWRRGPIKAILRVMSEPIAFFGIFGPAVLLVTNVAWPHRVTHQSMVMRGVYVAARIVLLPCMYGGWLYLAASSRAHVVAELLALHFGFSYLLFLFCIEHVYEGVYRVPRAEYNRTAAAMQGSSYLPMPKWWEWATLGIEYHHIHHQNTRVPLYRMKECHADAPPGLWDAAGLQPLTARHGIHALFLSLWDADQRRYVPWPEWEWLEKLLAPNSPPVHVAKGKLA